MEDIDGDEDAPESELEYDGPDALTSWEEFAASRLEWATEAACPLDLLYVQYARWCASSGLPLLPESDVLDWLRKNGATVRTSTYAQLCQVEGIRVMP